MSKTNKTDQEWKAQLSDEQYRVTRQAGTEAPFSGEYEQCWDTGWYHCVCCGHALFDSNSKFNAGCGWPSFTRPLESDNVVTKEDRKLWMVRTEVHCSRCGAHLGHVFDDGPKPTGLRYCMNGVALQFIKMEIPDE